MVKIEGLEIRILPNSGSLIIQVVSPHMVGTLGVRSDITQEDIEGLGEVLIDCIKNFAIMNADETNPQ